MRWFKSNWIRGLAPVLILFTGLMMIPTSGFSQQTQAAPGKRVALVIGNSRYHHIQPLQNPVEDAMVMARSLRQTGFEVVTAYNQDRAGMLSALQKFALSLERGGVALVYYAGHGIQVKGANYLVPVDAQLKRGDEDFIDEYTLSLSRIMGTLDSAQSRVNIVVLDACRDNPFEGGFRSASRGLALETTPAETWLVFATDPGKKASDDSGFTAAFASHILEAGLEMSEVMRLTTRDVLSKTSNEQRPWANQSVTTAFYFSAKKEVPIASVMPAEPPTQHKPEVAVVNPFVASPSTQNDSPIDYTTVYTKKLADGNSFSERKFYNGGRILFFASGPVLFITGVTTGTVAWSKGRDSENMSESDFNKYLALNITGWSLAAVGAGLFVAFMATGKKKKPSAAVIQQLRWTGNGAMFSAEF